MALSILLFYCYLNNSDFFLTESVIIMSLGATLLFFLPCNNIIKCRKLFLLLNDTDIKRRTVRTTSADNLLNPPFT